MTKLIQIQEDLNKELLKIRERLMTDDLKCPIMQEYLNVLVTYEHRYNEPILQISLRFYNRQIAIINYSLEKETIGSITIISTNLSRKNTNGTKNDMKTPYEIFLSNIENLIIINDQ